MFREIRETFGLNEPIIQIISVCNFSLVSNLLKREPADRLSLAEILAHPWMQQQPSPQPTDSPLHHNQNNRVQANNTSNHAQHLSVNTITGGYRPPYSTTSAAASSLASYRRYPVITRDMITDDEHKEIVECMTMQNIADEPAILEWAWQFKFF